MRVVEKVRWLWPERLPLIDKLGIIVGLSIVGYLVAMAILTAAPWYLPVIMFMCTVLAAYIFMLQDAPEEIEEIGGGIRDAAHHASEEAHRAWNDAIAAARRQIEAEQPPPAPGKPT